ncbi:MAG: LL-diaminopimelate aminotransferase [Clostridiales bacterium]|nr:LL-diaminopimelate aminotransferase [Clostridiales bacterium]
MQESQRMQSIPPYLFARIESIISEKREQGIDVINLGIGDPDLPTPHPIVEELYRTALDPHNHHYPSSIGMLSFRRTVARYYARRFGVHIEPNDEVCAVIGTKEGIANINYCYVNPGDINLVPDPSYPVYTIATGLAGGQSYYMPLLAENGFLPVFEDIPATVLDKAKILWLNYPHNPTAAIADLAFFEKAVVFARRHNLLICHDSAYCEIIYDGYVAPSILQVPGAKEVAVEFGSCSKPFNMTGWRVGYCVGNAEVVKTLARYKSNVDSGVFQAVQYAGMTGLDDYQPFVKANRAIYEARRDILVDGLNKLGWNLPSPKATFYIWAPVPKGYTSDSFAEFLLNEAAVAVTPGNGYGPAGEGFFRATLTLKEDRLKEAIGRLRRFLVKVEF